MIDEKNYTPTRVGYECAAMMRFFQEKCDSKQIEYYPSSQWGLLGAEVPPADDNCDPLAVKRSTAECLGRILRRVPEYCPVMGRTFDDSLSRLLADPACLEDIHK